MMVELSGSFQEVKRFVFEACCLQEPPESPETALQGPWSPTQILLKTPLELLQLRPRPHQPNICPVPGPRSSTPGCWTHSVKRIWNTHFRGRGAGRCAKSNSGRQLAKANTGRGPRRAERISHRRGQRTCVNCGPQINTQKHTREGGDGPPRLSKEHQQTSWALLINRRSTQNSLHSCFLTVRLQPSSPILIGPV